MSMPKLKSMGYSNDLYTLDALLVDKASNLVSKMMRPIKTKYNIKCLISLYDYYTIRIDNDLKFCINIDNITASSLYFSYLFDKKYNNSHIIIKNESKHLILPENGVYSVKLDKYTIATAIVSSMRYGAEGNDDGKSFEIQIAGINAQTWFKRVKHGVIRMYKSYLAEENGFIIVSQSGRNKVIYPKDISNIVMDKDIKEDVLRQIHNFMNNKKAYKSINNPYKLGILIKGDPGTGKSSFAYSLAKTIGCNVKIIKPEDIRMGLSIEPSSQASYNGMAIGIKQRNRSNDLVKSSNFNILLIEEIDSLMDTNKKMDVVENQEDINVVVETDGPRNFGPRYRQRLLSEPLRRDQILGYIDDLPENTILIATTNLFDTLDPAMIRPGRFDIKFEMNNFDKEKALQMVLNHGFDESFLDKYEEYPICPATIQYDMVQEKCENIIKGENHNE